MKVVLTIHQANQLLQYLSSKPYGEVVNLIDLIQKGAVQDEPVLAPAPTVCEQGREVAHG